MQIVYSFIAFLIAIAILVSFHEFGHFWVARRLGVKVLRFSIGFGRPLITWHDKKGTEYVIAMIPLGGYVKMLDETEGEVAETEKHLAFNRQSLAVRIAVVIAGPLFNIVLALFAYWLMLVVGIQSIAPIIGQVTPGSIAQQAGLHSQQEIVAIAQRKTNNWEDVTLALMTHIGERQQLSVTTQNVETKQLHVEQLNLVDWVIDARSPDLLASLGIQPYFPLIPPIIGKTMANYPAALANLKAGDRILSIDKKAIKDWHSFVSYIRVRPNKSTLITVARQDKRISVTVIPQSLKDNDGKTYGFIGVQSKPGEWPVNFVRTQRYSLWYAWWPATKMTAHMIKLTFVMLGKMVTGKISFRSISGPIGIAQGAGMSAHIGFAYYLGFLAVISISLGVLNILPIPMLDGGHLLYYIIELIIGRPVSERIRVIGLKMGMLMLLCLMALAFYNDISRLIG